jgi:glucokinase
MTTYLGVDLGATTIRAVVGDATGRVDGSDRRPTPQGPTGEAVVAAIRGAVRAACADAGVTPTGIAAAGVGAIGPLDRDAGATVEPPNLQGVERVPIVDPLAALLSTDRIVLRNDAAAGAVGERFFDDAADNLVYLTISTGIGAGAVVDGRVLSGRAGNAAEVGHVTVEPDGRRCGCGGAGHWEAYCSGERAPGYARDLHDGAATSLPLSAPDFDAEALFDAAGDDAFATRVVDMIADRNTLGVAAVVHAFAPEAVVVGGGVAINHPERVLGPIRKRLPDHVATDVPDLRLTGAGDDAVVRGALAGAIDADDRSG